MRDIPCLAACHRDRRDEHKGVCEVGARWGERGVMRPWRQMSIVLLPIAVIGTLAFAADVAMDNAECAPIDVAYETTELTQREIAWLFEADYRGNPQDGGEMLYAPGCDMDIVWIDGRERDN
jgi:hypothetical protein